MCLRLDVSVFINMQDGQIFKYHLRPVHKNCKLATRDHDGQRGKADTCSWPCMPACKVKAQTISGLRLPRCKKDIAHWEHDTEDHDNSHTLEFSTLI